MKFDQKITRRDFLKLSGLVLGGLALPKPKRIYAKALQQYAEGASLGRICVGKEGAWFYLKTEPNVEAPDSTLVLRDDVVEWKREVVANVLDYNVYNQRWVETPQGYIQSSMVQPIKYRSNQVIQTLPANPDGSLGMWVEITKPVVDIKPTRVPAASYWIREVLRPRIYYSQIFWASAVRQDGAAWEYLLSEKWGAEPDAYWADATACRPISPEEASPIHPDVGDKVIKVDMNYQTLSCFEGSREVYYCDVSSGGPLTPEGTHTIWRKMISTHMSSDVMGFDSSGIGWTTIFEPNGAAIHSAYWHNNFGTPLSHGCINCRPGDAQWIWRWVNPQVAFYPGELTVFDWINTNSTKVQVITR